LSRIFNTTKVASLLTVTVLLRRSDLQW